MVVRAKFMESHSSRVSALRNSREIAICIHEAGHATMLNQHSVGWKVRLPMISAQSDGSRLLGNADMIPASFGSSRVEATDICFGGYCGELAFLDEAKVISGSTDFYVNAANARNDILRFLQITNVKIPPSELRALESDPTAGATVVKECFSKYGLLTYAKMLVKRDILLNISDYLYNRWKNNGFTSTLVFHYDLII